MVRAADTMRADDPRTLPDGTVLRPLSEERGELETCVDLQRTIWGNDFSDVAAPQILRVVQAMGGVAAGAFHPPDRLIGFVFGLTGFKDGRPMHWSHMLAVLPEARGRDLGYHLKLYQRERLLPLGLDAMRWTFDPLVSKNAYLNLVRLGARVVAYHQDYYGSGDDSALSAGIGTDRFVVEWRLGEPVPDPVAVSSPDRVPRDARTAPVVNDDPGGPPETEGEEEPVVRVEVPGDIQAVLARSGEEAMRWRSATRDAIQARIARGWRVDTFYRDREGSFYVLRKTEAP